MGFSHQDLTVEAGTTVLWLQNDPAIHTTTSGAPGAIADVWDSGNLGQDETFSFTFDEPGEFPYFCTIHTSMVATITVVAEASAGVDVGTAPY